MEQLLRPYADIFDYFSSLYFFENTPQQTLPHSKVWSDLDLQIKRLFSLNQILDSVSVQEEDIDIFSRLSHLANTDVHKILTQLSTQVDWSQVDWSQVPLPADGGQRRAKFYDTHITDSYEITFDKLFANVIIHLNRNGYLPIDKSLSHIQFILQNFNQIKQLMNNELKSTGISSINFYINYFYGTLPVNSKLLVREVVGIINQTIEKRYPCLHIDTDLVIIKSRKDIDDMLKYLGLPYHIEEISDLIIFNRKKLIKIYKNKEVKIRGFPDLDSEQLKLLGFGI